MKRVTFLILTAVLLIPTAVSAGGQITIGVSFPVLWHPFYVTMKTEAEKTAADLGVRLLFVDAQYSEMKQASDLNDFVTQKVSAVLIAPMTVDSMVPALEKTVAAGIPVATVDRKANTDKVLVHVGGDNVEGGRAAARYIIDKLGNKGNVIELEGSPGSSPAIDRKKGFEEVIGGSHVKLLVSESASFDRGTARRVMGKLIKAYPKFDAVFAANDDMIIGAIQAMSDSGIDPTKKVTIGYDVSTECLEYIKQGKLGATLNQLPGQQVSQALTILVDYVKNKNKPEKAVIYISPKLVTSAQ
jgi:ribose transport system substrate-binding protein